MRNSFIFIGLLFSRLCFAQEFDLIVQKYVNDYGFQGNVVVERNEHVVFQKSYGDSVVEFHIPNKEKTKFRIGSVSKQFTAAAVLLLRQDGKLDVNDHVSKYLNVPESWKDITIHELLTHSAGLVRDVPLATKEYSIFHELADLLSSIEGVNLAYTPGSRATYSNAGYTVLASIVQKISGVDFGEFLKNRVFTPLGMSDTGVDHDSLIIPDRAKGYVFYNGTLYAACCFDLSNVAGAGSLYSTAPDLLKWNSSFNTFKILQEPIQSLMFKSYTQLPGGEEYGYAWVIDKWKGQPFYWHNGEVDGYESDFSRFPAKKESIIILSNRMDKPGNNYLAQMRADLLSTRW